MVQRESIKFRAADALKTHLERSIPELEGKVRIADPDAEDDAFWPGVALVVGRFRLQPHEEAELAAPSRDSSLVEIGTMQGSIEMRLYASNAPERERLETRLLELLLEREGAIGVLVLPLENVVVGGVATSADVVASFELENDDWRDELAFARRRFSFIDLSVAVPALMLRRGRYPMESLQTGLVAEREPTAESLPEYVVVNDDGSTTKP